jgi:hypothetical protein
MFPKKGEDAVHIEGECLVVTMINVTNPLTNEKIPDDDLINHFEFTGDDGVPLAGKCNPEATRKLGKVVWVDKNLTFTMNNWRQMHNKIIPVGDKIKWYLPNPGWKKGEDHRITFHILQDHPIKFTIERTIE